MRALLRYIPLILCLLWHTTAAAQPHGEAIFSLSWQGNELHLDFRTGPIALSPSDNGFAAIESYGLTAAPCQPGEPEMPVASRLVVLPRGARLQPTRTILSDDTLMMLPPGRLLQPAAPPTPKDSPSPLRTPDSRIYGSPTPYRGGSAIAVENIGQLGDRQIVRLTLRPFLYHPSSGQLTVSRHLSAHFTLSADNPAATPTASSPQPLLVAVVRSEMLDLLQPLLQWKRQEGYRVRVCTVERTTQRSETRKKIRAIVQADEPDAPMPYLLLVGDTPWLPAYTGNAQPAEFNTHVTDLYYAEHTGDYLPDMMVGRLPAADSAELALMVQKTIAYERGDSLDTAALKRLLLVAGHEASAPAPITTNGQVDYLARRFIDAWPAIDTLCYRNPESDNHRPQIISHLSDGISLVNYTAHCTDLGWSHPQLRQADIEQAAPAMPAPWVNNCCSSNAFGGSCFGESLMRQTGGGAVAVIGATNNTLWNEDYYWAVGPRWPFELHPEADSLAVGAFDAFFAPHHTAPTMGQLLTAGNLAVTAFGSPYDKFYWETYCLLGDPTLRPWIGLPDSTTLALADTLRAGDIGAEVTAPAGSLVTLMQGDSLWGTARADATGLARLALAQSLDTGQATLTATLPNRLPRMLHITPGTPRHPIALYGISPSDTSLTVTVANLGGESLSGIRLTLLQDSTDLADYGTIMADTAIIDTLPAGARTLATLHCHLAQPGRQAGWQAHLTATADTHLTSIEVRHRSHTPWPSAAFALLNDDGTMAHSLQHNRHYLWHSTVSGSFDSISLAITALPGNQPLAAATLAEAEHTLAIATPDSITHLHLKAQLHTGRHIESYDRYIVAGKRSESFEDGFNSHPWRHAGTRHWTIDSSRTHDGHYSARSGHIDYRQTSDLILPILLHRSDTLRYWVSTSSEPQYDRLSFSVDGQEVDSRSGETDWKSVVVPLAEGNHLLRWRYSKDELDNAGEDCAWIDGLQLPLAQWDSAYGWFGQDDDESITTADSAAPHFTILSPNPTTGMVNITCSEAIETMQVLDLSGRELLHLTVEKEMRHTLDLRHLPDGIYLLRVSSHHTDHTSRIIIQRRP